MLLGPVTVFRVVNHLLDDAVKLFLRSSLHLSFDFVAPLVKDVFRRDLAIELLDELRVGDRSFRPDQAEWKEIPISGQPNCPMVFRKVLARVIIILTESR